MLSQPPLATNTLLVTGTVRQSFSNPSGGVAGDMMSIHSSMSGNRMYCITYHDSCNSDNCCLAEGSSDMIFPNSTDQGLGLENSMYCIVFLWVFALLTPSI